MEIEIIRVIQSFSNPFLNKLFEFSTIFGEELIIIPLLTFIYWIIDKKFGEYIGFSIFTSLIINNSDVFKLQRPIGEEEIRSLRTYITTEYSSPSGHTQGASSFYSAISIYLKKVIYFISAVIIFLVGYSRMYLGVHYPKDVIVGVILGILIFIFATILFNKIKNKPLLYYVVFIFGLIFLSFSNSPDYIKVLGTYFGFVNGLFIEKNMLILK